MGIMGYNLDPLILVMPFLISLMAFRHSHQLYNRYYEEYISTGDNLAGIRVVIEKMFLPGLTSIVTDAFGIAIVAELSFMFWLLLKGAKAEPRDDRDPDPALA